MLTKNEKEWLENREEMPGYYCLWCPLWDDDADCDGRSPHPFCPIFQRRERLWDAAEFSERVAAELAEMAQYNIKFGCDACPAYIDDAVPCKPYCAALLLKTARLQVEEEMDG